MTLMALAACSSLAPKPVGKIRKIGGAIGAHQLVVLGTLPEYPGDSLKSGISGLAVVAIELDGTGRLSSLEVVQYPDPQIKAAVESAVKSWSFRPPSSDIGRGKLYFYFRIVNGTGKVYTPVDLIKDS